MAKLVSAAPLLAVGAAFLVAACGASDDRRAAGVPTNPPGWDEAFDRALTYLETTEAEFGLDVTVTLQVVGELTGEPRPARAASARRPHLPPKDVATYGVLLDVAKPPLPPSSLHGVEPSPGVPDPETPTPTASDGGSLIDRCVLAVLRCEVDDECRAFVEADGYWGYVLTHQALWLLIAHWLSCSTGVDVEARRHRLGASLALAMLRDPTVSDLALERLAMLGHLGFANDLDPEWIGLVLAAQEPVGCWRVRPGDPCHPHPTGLALWGLAHARAADRWPPPDR